MATTIEYALLAGASYYDTRAEVNRFPLPENWSVISRVPQDGSTGFEVSAYKNSLANEIVISYAGTYDKDILGDVAADIALGAGLRSDQLFQAAEYYMQVKTDNPTANITLTGHSLGGGLASLIAVFFNETAVTFDQAPFRNSASWMWATELRIDLALKFPASTYPQISDLLAPLDRFILSFDPLGLGWSQDGLDAREAKVTNLSVQGEFLSVAPALKIGSELPPLAHGDYFAPLNLHSQALLSAFLQSQQTAATGQALNDVTFKLTDLLGMIFDKNLYSFDTDKGDENLLEYLVRHEAGIQGSFSADAMVTRFTTDLWKIAQDGGLTLTDANIAKALTAFAMQMYYENANASATDKELFSQISGGLHFNREDVASSLSETQGYSRYFLTYLQENFTARELDSIIPALPDLKDWFVQVGSAPMNATASGNSAFMLGGSSGDNMTGGWLAGDAANDFNYALERCAA